MQLESEVHGGGLDVAVPQESGARRIARASGPPVEACERWHRLAEVLGGEFARAGEDGEHAQFGVAEQRSEAYFSYPHRAGRTERRDRVRPRALACFSRRYDPIGASRLGSWA